METLKSPEQSKVIEVHVRDFYFNSIEDGSKTLELRVAYANFKDIKKGDIIEFKTKTKSLRVRVLATRAHHTLESVLETEDVSKIAPKIDKDNMRQIAEGIFRADDVERKGLIVIEFEKINL